MAKKISQLKLPAPSDTDPHPRLLLMVMEFMPANALRPCSRMAGMKSRWRLAGRKQVPPAGTSPLPATLTCAQWACS